MLKIIYRFLQEKKYVILYLSLGIIIIEIILFLFTLNFFVFSPLVFMLCYLLFRVSAPKFQDTEKIFFYYLLLTISFFLILIISPNIVHEIVEKNIVFGCFFISNILAIGWAKLLNNNFLKEEDYNYNLVTIYKLIKITSLIFLILGAISNVIFYFVENEIIMFIYKLGGILYGVIKSLVVVSVLFTIRKNFNSIQSSQEKI